MLVSHTSHDDKAGLKKKKKGTQKSKTAAENKVSVPFQLRRLRAGRRLVRRPAKDPSPLSTVDTLSPTPRAGVPWGRAQIRIASIISGAGQAQPRLSDQFITSERRAPQDRLRNLRGHGVATAQGASLHSAPRKGFAGGKLFLSGRPGGAGVPTRSNKINV